MRKVAIVGSEEKYWTQEQRTVVIKKIREILQKETPQKYDPTGHDGTYKDRTDITLVSGGCSKDGVDIWAEIVADVLGIEKDIKYPEVYDWEDGDHIEYIYKDVTLKSKEMIPVHFKKKGYKSRNIEIAEVCNVLYCIDPKNRKWSGGRWTMEYAKNLGKEVHLVEID